MKVDYQKAARGFAALFLGLVEHAPELALAALAAYGDVAKGDTVGAAIDAGKAAPALKDIVEDVAKARGGD